MPKQEERIFWAFAGENRNKVLKKKQSCDIIINDRMITVDNDQGQLQTVDNYQRLRPRVDDSAVNG